MTPTLRPWQEKDATSLSKYGNNRTIFDNMTDGFPSPYTIEKAKKFIAYANESNPPSILAIELNGEAIGGIGLHQQADIQRKNAELGYWIGEPFWGKGIISQSIQLMVAYGFEQFDINRIYARPFGTNIGSQKALEKAGFMLEAHLKDTIYKNEQYIDELIYAIRRNT